MTVTNPTLAEVLKTACEAYVRDLHTAMPGIVQSYDPKTQTADVQPALKRTFADDTTVPLPLLSKIPVLFQRSALGFVHVPLQVGDSVLLVFCERSIDLWRSLGVTIDPDDDRTHDLSDAVAIPGLFSNLRPIANTKLNGTDVTVGNALSTITLTQTGDVLIANALGSIELTPTGKIKLLGGGGTVEIISLLNDILSAIQSITTATAIGIQPILNIAQFAAIQTQLALVKG